MDRTGDSHHSALRERIVEHLFIGDALQRLWQRRVFDVEVLRAEFDNHGYDLVMEHGQVVRHIQFKTGVSKKPGKVSLSVALADKPSGCVIWIGVDAKLVRSSFYWFGAEPGQSLPPIAHYPNPRRTTHNKDGVRPPRQNHRVIPGSAFRAISDLDELLELLFGNLPEEKHLAGR